MNRYRVVVVHGERATVYHVVDSAAPEGDQPAILESFRVRARAERLASWLNEKPRPYREDRTMARRRVASAVDTEIERLYYRNAQGVQINVLDIGKVFAAGRAAASAGQSIEEAVRASIAALRQN